jgi:hypothetical protein
MSIDNCPAMSWAEFLAIPNGTTVFNHGASECVALANQYNEGVLGGGFVQVGSALEWWTNPNVATVHGFSRIDSSPQVGDIFIASGDIYNLPFGHIGVVIRAWDGSTFGTMEQNVTGEYVSRHDRTMANVDGFLRPINQEAIAPAPVVLTPTQRQAGPQGVFRREAPTTQSARLEGDLEPNEVGNFIGWSHGESINGNDVWFMGISGNWFWSGAFTSQSVDSLTDLNAVNVVVETPAPVEEVPAPESTQKPKPIEPERKKPIIKKEKPVANTKEEKPVIPAIHPADLGAIITNNRTRKIVWAVYGILGLVILAGMGGLQAINGLAPEWFMFTVGAYAALGPAFSSLAIANISSNKK